MSRWVGASHPGGERLPWAGWASALILWMHVNRFLFGEPFPWGGGGYSVGGVSASNLGELVGLLALVCGLLVALVGLLLVTTLGEETMFRGYMQTLLTRRYGVAVGLAVPALCFALRHLPSDLYWAGVNQATPMQWAARLGELGVAALILGLTRQFGRTTAASWVTHAIMWFAMLFGLYSLFGL
ncbi:MAG: CPBP family intramembrane metalloprotease [Chloroflexi bacterium]|nr:CPBP family intramembrane metalloprotease [Chloroflexota bacterium]MBU1750638.1 CPBP family intramembrane metalloprotease [Chloroflexota bacterium]